MKHKRLFLSLVIILTSWSGVVADDDWCDRALGGPAGTDFAVDLSASHAGARFFGVQTKYSIADQALASAVNDPAALTTAGLAALQAYSESLGGVCIAPDNTAALGPAQVTVFGDFVLVRPGTGSVSIPSNASVVLIDLRDLPAVPGLRSALDAAVAPALKMPVDRPDLVVRRHFGMADELVSSSVYSNSLERLSQADIPATAPNGPSLTLALITGGRLAPETAQFAGTLRLAGRAWLVGDDVFSSVAESRWRGVGSAEQTGSGLVYRVEDLFDGGKRWPDVIPADIRTDNPDFHDLARLLRGSGNPPHLTAGDATRPLVQVMSPAGDRQPPTLRLGDMRGMLLVSHGTVRLFFPYFPVVGDTIDARLLETLGALGAGPFGIGQARRSLARFTEAFHDGHAYWYDISGRTAGEVGFFPLLLKEVAGEPAVFRSVDSNVHPGDVVTTIDGTPALDWFTEDYTRVSAATDGYRFVLATFDLVDMFGPMQLGLRAPDGTTRTVVVNPVSLALFNQLYFLAPTLRPAGRLTDLGAPDLYYINMDEFTLTNIAAFRTAIEEAKAAAGLVIDMRGYPAINHYEAAQRLICQTFSSPLFNVPVLSGPDLRSVDSTHYTFSPLNPYCGPAVLLVDHGAVSASENFSTMLVDAHRVKVVGRRSAGTNGNNTRVQLPGDILVVYTGMEVLHTNGSQFHGIGILPDVVVEPQAQDFADGRDRALEVAIQTLHQMGP